MGNLQICNDFRNKDSELDQIQNGTLRRNKSEIVGTGMKIDMENKTKMVRFDSGNSDEIEETGKVKTKPCQVYVEGKGKISSMKFDLPIEPKPQKVKVYPDLPKKYKDVVIDSSKKVEKPWLYKNTQNIKEGLTKLGKTKSLESWNEDSLIIKVGNEASHGMLTAVQLAHSYHYPLQISPDDMWTMIMQGFCQHMELKHEELRDKFVNFDGKKNLTVQKDSFVKGRQNAWPEVFAEFSTQIKQNIGDENHGNLVPDFSTTTPLSKVIHELSLMNAMQHFFSFRCHTDCGISTVRLEGELSDWEKLREATTKLDGYGLDWWTPTLLEILDKIIETYKDEGNVDKDFWKHIYKYYYGGGSGVNPSIDGWIINLIPYIDDKQSVFAKRSLAKTYEEYADGDKPAEEEGEEEDDDDDFFMNVDLTQPGLDIEKLKKAASGINKTPFVWNYKGDELEMNFLSGFAGAAFTEDGFIKAQMAWGVCEKESQVVKVKSTKDEIKEQLELPITRERSHTQKVVKKDDEDLSPELKQQ